MRKILSISLSIALALFSLASATAQVATGTYPFGTFDARGLDTINVGNLNVNLNIPVMNKSGRGLPFNYSLLYNSSVWSPSKVNGVTSWVPANLWGWAADTTAATGFVSFSTTTSTSPAPGGPGGTGGPGGKLPTCTTTTYSNWVYYDALGTAHLYDGSTSAVGGDDSCPQSSASFTETAQDGSGYTIAVSLYKHASLTTPKGRAIRPAVLGNGSGTVQDSNGNQISVDASGNFTDTTGNVVLAIAGAAPSAHTFTYKDTTGTARVVQIAYKTYTVQTEFGCTGVGEYGPTSTSLVDSISYPDGSTYHFKYEPTPSPGGAGNVTGRLAGVQVPQGGWINYTYPGANNGIVCTDGSALGLTRSLASDSGSAASNITYTRTTGTNTSHTEVVDGNTNHFAYDFVNASNQPVTTTALYYETNRSIYQGAETGTPFVARKTCYNLFIGEPPCSSITTQITLPIAALDTFETLDGLQQHGSTLLFNAYGQPTERDDYDFGGATARGILLKQEKWAYAQYGSAILVANDRVYDGSGALAGQTSYGYDQTSVTVTSGLPQHSGTIGSSRGNLTTTTQYINASTSLATTITYEDTGNPLTVKTPNGTSTYSYDSATHAFLTSAAAPTPSSGVALASTATYSASTGIALSATDPNLSKASYSAFDLLLNPTEIDSFDSTGAQVGKTTGNYTPTLADIKVYQSSSSTNPSESQTQYDAYGRPSRTLVANGQSTNPWYQEDICYDGNGNAQFTSYRYQGTGFSTAKVCSVAGDVTHYDVLGRVQNVQRQNGESVSYTYLGRSTETTDENLVKRISQVDGLGRLSLVCEISSNGSMPNSGAPATCGTDIPATGFTTGYTYNLANSQTTITQGAQSRTFITDWLGRTTSVQEPESGQTTYSYTYNATGLQVVRTRPTANQTVASVTTNTTTQYDSVGRVVSIVYTDGTPTKTFAYDASAGWSDITQTYLKGRLSIASVSGASTVYSYDALGRVAALDECLPSGCGTVAYNKKLLYNYDWAGDQLSSSDGAGVTTTYTPTVANEIQSISSSLAGTGYPATILSSAQNGPNGPVTAALGNGLNNVYGYDTLGRLSNGWVCSGSQSASCAGGTQSYGFAANWKGVQLASSTDSVLAQTSSYTYDEFNRLTARTVTSGTAQNFNWIYDRYGNRWHQNPLQSGPTSSLSFTNPTNQISSAACTGICPGYDAAGNYRNDGYHAYTYDAEGNVTQVDAGSTAQYVYNALNQRVRTTVGTTIKEFVFNASGQRVSIWNGSTHAQIQGQYYWGSMPVAYYAGGATHFQHQDWLGTERMRTTYTGTVEGQFTSLPFGDAKATTGSDGDAYHFAALDSDSESTTDHAVFRQYSNTQGRWMSPDPYSGSYDLFNPQSLNRYAYAPNNPLAFVDRMGLDWECTSDSWTWTQIIYPQADGTEVGGDSTYTNNNDGSCTNLDSGSNQTTPVYGANGSGYGDGNGFAQVQGRGPYRTPQQCQALANKINNLLKLIAEKQGDLNNPSGNLILGRPYAGSVIGHQVKLGDHIDNLASVATEYEQGCGGGPPAPPNNGSPATKPVPIIVPPVLWPLTPWAPGAPMATEGASAAEILEGILSGLAEL